MEEKDKEKNVINNFEAGSNCQVFNGPVIGGVFAMPGSTVNNYPSSEKPASEESQSVGAAEEPHAQSGKETEEEREVEKIEEKKLRLSESRQEIADQIMTWVQKGDWLDEKVADGVRTMMSEMLAGSEVLWQLLEQGRGDRVRIVWQNIVGYLDDKKLLRKKGTPALNADFFGDTEGYTNIDKGRPSSKNISSSFNRLLPILEEFTSKI